MTENISKTGTQVQTGTGLSESHTHVRESYDGVGFMDQKDEQLGLDYDNDLKFIPDDEVRMDGSEPMNPLPTFQQKHEIWPAEMQEVVDVGRTPAQRDIMQLGYLVVIGAILGNKVRTLYNGKWLSPSMLFFAVAPPASGKGVLAWLRHIVQPFHDALRRDYDRQMADFKQEKMKYDSLGKARATEPNVKIPEPPVRKFFIIPGNNSGTGMAANLINSGGHGIIFETEADTLSSALSAEYGHFDDTLRNTFDHERISYYRRGEDESRECENTYLSMLLSGTPGQVKPLLGSGIENGLTSRIIWYYMPAVREWQNQFDRKEDMSDKFRAIGRLWKDRMDKMKGVSNFSLELTDIQQHAFNIYMSGIFDRGQHAVGEESVSSVIRIAHHILRIMSVVALLRAFEKEGGVNPNFQTSQVFSPAQDIPADNVKDGIVSRYVYGITQEDFVNCLLMANVLFTHAVHILSLLPPIEISNRGSADKEKLFHLMPETFTRQEYLEKAGEMQINENTALQWIKRAMKKKQLLKVGRGQYQFINSPIPQ